MPGDCSVRLTRRYREPPAEVWRALTEASSLARWLRPGFDVPRVELEPGRVLELDWRPPGEAPSVVRIELEPAGDGTLLVLEHTRIEAARGMAAIGFWTGAVSRLALTERA
jgi:uncharacterized protein YndB with AHSA1/START domain